MNAMAAHYDLIIRGGTVVDGTGAPARRADVGVRAGRIAAVEPDLEDGAERALDAGGLVVAPGFIDIHTHYDAQVFWDRMLTISPWHGVTTVVMGNCGFGIAPTRPSHRELILRTLENVEGMSFEALQAGLGEDWPFETFGEFLDAIERRGTLINVGALVGHTPIRLYVMGEDATEREATQDEIRAMEQLVDAALEAGALGFASSKSPTHVGYAGRPVPSRAASFEEIARLAARLEPQRRGVVQATLGPGFFLDEFAEICRRSGRAVSWTALLAGMLGADGHRTVLERCAELQAGGIEVVPQVACRPLMFEFQMKAPFLFESMSIFHDVSAADLEGKKRIYADAAWRAEFRARMGAPGFATSWEHTVISEFPPDPSLEERYVMDVARERGVDATDLVVDLSLQTNLEARFRMAVLNTDEDAVAELLRSPAAMLGLSDAGAHASQLCDACFSTHLLAHWVRDKRVLTLEEAVRLLTSRAAEVFDIRDRGRLAPGLAADIVVFDPDTVGCTALRRVRDLPGGADRLVADATGVHAVVVNGVVVREGDTDTVEPEGPLPGAVLRGGKAV